MQYFVALLFFLPILGLGLFQIHKKNTAGGTATCLVAILIGAFIISRDLIKNFSILGASLQLKEDIEIYKEDALADAKTKIDAMQISVNELINSANETKAELATQKDAVNVVIQDTAETAKKLEEQRKISEGLFSEIEEQRKSLNDLYALSEKTKADIIRLNEAAKDLQMTYIKIAYLQTETKGSFGGPVNERVGKEIEYELNRLLNVVFSNDKDRIEFVTKVTNILK
jgi:hypothetical protein